MSSFNIHYESSLPNTFPLKTLMAVAEIGCFCDKRGSREEDKINAIDLREVEGKFLRSLSSGGIKVQGFRATLPSY